MDWQIVPFTDPGSLHRATSCNFWAVDNGAYVDKGYSADRRADHFACHAGGPT